jgi:hypothetical protein
LLGVAHLSGVLLRSAISEDRRRGDEHRPGTEQDSDLGLFRRRRENHQADRSHA